MTATEIASKRELLKIKRALLSVEKPENSATKLNNETTIDEKKPEAVESTENEDDIMFIAFGRIYSGTIRRGQDIYVLGPKHDPSKTIDKVCFIGFYF